MRKHDEAAFQSLMEKRRESYSAAVARASHVAESAAFATGAVCQGVGQVLFASLRGMLSASSLALNTAGRRLPAISDGGEVAAASAASSPARLPDAEREFDAAPCFDTCKACTHGSTTSHRTHTRIGLCKKTRISMPC